MNQSNAESLILSPSNTIAISIIDIQNDILQKWHIIVSPNEN